jgi:O-antigen ligase
MVVAIWHFARGYRQRVLLMGVFAALGLAAYILLQQWSPTHFGRYTDDLSLLSRVVLWYTAWGLFLSSPLHGVGFGTFSFIYEQYLPHLSDLEAGLQVHNIYLELLAETGILGFVSFFALVAAAFREARHHLRSTGWLEHSLAFGVAGGTVAILVHSFFEHDIFWAPQTGGLFWILLATIVAAPFRTVKAGAKG